MSVNHKNHNTAPRARRNRVLREPAQHRIYVASPLSTYHTTRYDRMLSRVRECFPESVILPARDLFASNADWRSRWPDILPTLDALVFFDDDAGCIGAGTERELADALAAAIPVYFLTPPPFDRLDPLTPCETLREPFHDTRSDDAGAVSFEPVIGGGMRQTLRVCLSVPADAALALLLAHGNGGG